jgi:NADH-quinone oxidoreductase subunit L
LLLPPDRVLVQRPRELRRGHESLRREPDRRFRVHPGVFLIYVTVGSFQFTSINAAAATTPAPGAFFWIGLLLFVGLRGKAHRSTLRLAADAMAGPTPVSALIHAATMVTSGVYLVARSARSSPRPESCRWWPTIGALTALLAALIALTQTDIKKVLAYSTVSQLGYMFLGAGVGAYGVAVFHLVTTPSSRRCSSWARAR